MKYTKLKRWFSHTFATVATVATVALLLTACEDPVPNDYVQEIYVEGFVIAGRPLTHVRVNKTLPVSDSFSTDNAVLRDAEVIVLENGTPIQMMFVDDSTGGYYAAADTSFRAKHNATYDLTVRALGQTLQATARTLSEFDWTAPPKDTIVYPGKENETKQYDSLNISWQSQPSVTIYVIGIECRDTSGYGKYLTPPTTDTNTRVRDDEFDDGLRVSNETTRYGLAFTSTTPVVWRAFKWYGAYTLHIYAGDLAFQEWFQLVGGGRRSSYDYRLSNMSGGLGVWAGASVVSGDLFLKKQP